MREISANGTGIDNSVPVTIVLQRRSHYIVLFGESGSVYWLPAYWLPADCVKFMAQCCYTNAHDDEIPPEWTDIIQQITIQEKRPWS